MRGARGVLINITGGYDMTLFEVDEAANRIRKEVDEDANIIFGSSVEDDLNGRIRVSVVATGIDAAQPRTQLAGAGAGRDALAGARRPSRWSRQPVRAAVRRRRRAAARPGDAAASPAAAHRPVRPAMPPALPAPRRRSSARPRRSRHGAGRRR